MLITEIVHTSLVYHGGRRMFRRFNPPRGTHPSKIGIWFTEDRTLAERIARQASRNIDDEPVLYACRLDLRNPVVFETYRDFLQTCGGDAAKARRRFMRQGFDGVEITHSDTDGGTVRRDFAVFSPDKVEIVEAVRLDPSAGIEQLGSLTSQN